MKIIYTINETDSTDTLMRDFGLSRSYCEGIAIRPGNKIVVRMDDTIVHVVRPAETLENIASLYNVSIDHIKENNHISAIFVGQHLLI